jgi:hypothetical protein
LLPVSPDLIELVQRPSFTGDDAFGGLNSGTEPWFRVVLTEVVADCGLQIANAGLIASADSLCHDFGKESFDNVQP